MTRGGIWRTLGIDRTADTAAIRRAYAQALRAMDPDADPDGFARLRAARDRALAMAREAAEPTAEAGDPAPAEEVAGAAVSPLAADAFVPPQVASGAAGTITATIFAAPIPPLSDARVDSGQGAPLSLPAAALGAPVVEGGGGDVAVLLDPPTARYDAAYNDLLALLHGDAEPDPARLHEVVACLLSDPRMARLAFAEDAERWFADVLAGAIPRSDPVLAVVADQFGWSHEVGTIGLSDAAERIAERARSITYWHAAAAPSHPDHRLWSELSRPVTGTARRGWFIGRRRMRPYLDKIVRSYPDAQEWFEPQRLAVWQSTTKARGPGWSLWGIGLFVLFRLLIAFGSGSGDDRTDTPVVTVPAVQTAVASYPRDVNLALLAFADGLTLERVEGENAPLARALNDRWRGALAAGTPIGTFIGDTRHYLYDRFSGALSRASYEDAAALRRLDLAELDRARVRGADGCASYLDDDLPVEQVRSREDEQQRRRIMAAILLADPRDTRAKKGATYAIPGSVMERLARETGLGRDALVAALDRRGPAKARCDARRALLGAALDLPRKTALPLLRGM